MERTEKIVAVAFIAVLVTVMLGTGLSTTRAGESEISGTNPAYSCTGFYCMCLHSTWDPGSYMDCWTSTGLAAEYDLNNPPPGVGYIRGTWIHQSASGGCYPQGSPMYCEFCCNQIYSQYVNDYDTPQWMYIEPFWGYHIYWWYDSYDFYPDVNSLESSTSQVFYDPYNPPLYGVIQTYTSPWSFMTAHYP